MRLIVAEKPSVARDLARVLGVRPGGRHWFDGKEDVISWCVGHLVELDEPAAYDDRWKAWRLDTLPMLPAEFKLRPVKDARDQLDAVMKLLKDGKFSQVVNACDAGREGELIFRYVYQLAGSRLPIERLWISSMTDEAVRAGFAALKPGARYENLADAARCRSEADWLVGLNATRAVTVRHRTGPQSPLYSIGRVQTPTLAILVEREKAVRDFVPSEYFEVRGKFVASGGASFQAPWSFGNASRLARRDAAEVIRGRVAQHGEASDPDGPVVESIEQKTTREAPPLLFDLTSLQRTANRRFGLSANQTLQVAQALYERHKVLTYPRTDARHLSGDLAAEMPKLFAGLERHADYAGFARRLLQAPPPRSKRVFDDTKVQDHHAIIPTGTFVALTSLAPDERKVFDLVARRFLGVFFPDAVFAQTEAAIRVGAGQGAAPGPKAGARIKGAAAAGEGARPDEPVLDQAPPPPDRFVARGRVRLEAGWQEVAGFGDEAPARPGKPAGKSGEKSGEKAGEEDEVGAVLPPLSQGQRLGGGFEVLAKKTRPPPRHSEGTLLAAMETAGRQIEDEELRAAMKDTGLGTPATRASIIETLLRRGFIERQGKQLSATAMGIALIEALPVATLGSAELTGQWEARLARIARGEDSRAAFMRDIASYVREVVAAVRAAPARREMATAGASAKVAKGAVKEAVKEAAKATAPDPAPAAPPKFKVDDLACPRCGQGHLITGKRGWGCSRWREGCAFVIWFAPEGKRLTKAALRKALAAAPAKS